MISLETTRDGWDGTFALAVEFVATDLLSDGAPVDVHLDADGGRSISGVLTECSNGFLQVDGVRVDVSDIRSFRVE